MLALRLRLLPFALLASLSFPLVRPSESWGQAERASADVEDESADTRPSIKSRLLRVVSLRDYNTRVVLMGASLLGLTAGVVGVFMLLRKRSLMGDVVSHCSLPGIGLAYVVMEVVKPGTGKWLPGLLIGAVVAGVTGMLCTVAIRRYTRVKEDAAMAIVLSIFFGVGVSMFTVIQNMPSGNAAGLNSFIFGQAASMIADDVRLIIVVSLVVLVISLLLFKEFRLLCFDERFGKSQGWPTTALDLLLMSLVVAVTVAGLQSVGLLLVVAMLIIPATAARFWSNRLGPMTFVSALLGFISASIGVLISAFFPRISAGAVIVLVSTFFFVISMFLGIRRGVLRRVLALWSLRRRIGEQHVLRAIYEHLESSGVAQSHDLRQSIQRVTFSSSDLLPLRTWPEKRLRRLLHIAERDGLLEQDRSGWRLTSEGAGSAIRVVRNHRLWEIYLIEYADIAPSHVDRDADQIEHILGPELVGELEVLFQQQQREREAPPPSPHRIATVE